MSSWRQPLEQHRPSVGQRLPHLVNVKAMPTTERPQCERTLLSVSKTHAIFRCNTCYCSPPRRAEVNVTRSLPSPPSATGLLEASSSTFRRHSLCPLRPHSAISGANLCRTPLLICAAGAHEGDGAMEITIHKHLIEQCVMMACASKAHRDKALWLTMAQSWGRLADEVERSEMAHVAAGRQHRH